MKKKSFSKSFMIVLSFILILILQTQALLAFDEYPYPVYDDGFAEGGFFNNEMDDEVYYSRSIADPYQQPYVEDIDNDGIKEVLVIDGDNINIYSTKSLAIEGGIGFDEGGSAAISNLEIVDIDGDGYKEIIYYAVDTNSDVNITIAQWNGTHSSYDNIIQTNLTATASTSKAMIRCDDARDKCFSVIGLSSMTKTYIIGFDNETWNYSREDSSASYHCLPKIPYIALEDYDSDGTKEFIYGYYQIGVGTDRIYIKWYDLNDDLTVTEEISTSTNTLDWDGGVGTCYSTVSTSDMSSVITNVLVFDYDTTKAGLETVVGAVYDGRDAQETFKIYVYRASGTLLDEHPEIFRADGQVLSNLVRADAFEDTGENDVCVMGWTTTGLLDVLCGSKTTSKVPETREFKMDAPWNITDFETETHFQNMIHASDMVENPSDRSEIISGYGSHYLIYPADDAADTSCSSISDCDMYLDYSLIDVPYGATVPIDYDNAQQSDLMVLTDSNIWYIDDGIGNIHCDGINQDCTSAFDTNPSIDEVMKENCTLRLRVTLFDNEDDPMQYRITLYKDHPNEQTTGWINGSSGFTYSHTDLFINQTVSSGILNVETRDLDDPAFIQTDEYDFAVDSSGDCFGDSLFEDDVPFTDPAVVDFTPTETTAGNNTITNSINTVSAWTGMGTALIWFVVMIIVAISMMVSLHQKASSSEFMILVGVIAFIEFMMLYVGYKLDYYGFGTVAAILVVALAIIALVIRNQITGTGSGG